MNCPHCQTANDNDNIFCVSCGKSLVPPKPGASTQPSPTEYYNPQQINFPENSPDSVQTAISPAPNFNAAPPNFVPPVSYPSSAPQKTNTGKFLLLGGFLLLLLLGGGIAAFVFLNRQPVTAETLPDHLGMFVPNADKKSLTEIGKQDFSNALQAKDDLIKNDALPVAEDQGNLLLYADAKDIPISDLKLVPLDSLKDDGSFKQINFQAFPIDGKPEIKRLRVSDGLANGKYAFALFDGFLDEGRHKFWAFQIKNAKADNGDLAKAVSLSVKSKQSNTAATNANVSAANTPTPAPTPKPTPPIPAGARVAYCASSNVVVRNSPDLSAKKINELKRGQKIYVINYSDNYDSWNGMEGNWAYIQTENGGRGWVFSPLLNY